MIRLAYPAALLLLLIVPFLWWLWRNPRRRPVIRFAGLSELKAAGKTTGRRLYALLPILRTVGIVALVVAVARPQRADQSTKVYVEGIAIELALDTSSSMSDVDLSPRGKQVTRFDMVRKAMDRFIKGDKELTGRPNDLIGLVRFARYADSICPLTLDHEALSAALAKTQMVTPPSPEDGTAIGDGLALAVERLRDLKRRTGSGEQLVIKSRVVILLTDGENNSGEIAPEQAADLAATYGIKVYTILAGTGERLDWGRRRPLDDTALRYIADTTGGKFFRVNDADALERVYEEIGKLEQSRAEEQKFVDYEELALPWLAAAFAALSLQTLLGATLMRKIP